MESTLALIIVLIFSAWAIGKVVTKSEITDQHFPQVSVEPQQGQTNAIADAVNKGYQTIIKGSDQPFYVRFWSKNYLVLPSKYLRDIRRADEEHLQQGAAISDVFYMYNWIGDLFKSQRMMYTVKKGLNPNLPKLSDAMFEESKYAFQQEFGDCTNPKEIAPLQILSKVSLRMSTRLIVGRELSQNDVFLRSMARFLKGTFLTAFIMHKLPFSPKVRDVVAWPVWKYHQVFNLYRVINTIKPVVAQRMEDFEKGRIEKDRFDIITCALRQLDEHPLNKDSEYTPEHTLSHETLHILWASTQSPARSVTSVILKLMEENQYVEPLRKEAKAAIDKHGWNDSVFNELPMMDSFIREIHRLNPIMPLGATRCVVGKAFTFSDGLTVPVGTRLGFPAAAMQQDPDFLSNPETFDGFRFYKLAANEKKEEDEVNKWAASYVSPSNMTFGYGNHVCPGRYIAIRLIKVMLCRLLVDYDIDWKANMGGSPDFNFEGSTVPSPSQAITVQARRDV